MPTPAASLALLDWLVLGGYFAVLLGVGWWCSRRAPASARDYFLAERSMPAWAVAISILATAQSAATFIGVPENSYRGDLTYLSASLAPLLAACIVGFVFLPRYYAANVSSPYELLETRCGPGARVATSGAYLAGRLLGSGARTFIGALPLSLAMFGTTDLGNVMLCIALIMLVGTCYTLVGGIRSVIWTDVLQVSVYIGAAVVALVVLRSMIPLSTGDLWTALRSATHGQGATVGSAIGAGPSKLTLLSMSTAPGAPFTLWTALSGLMLLNLAAMAVDQDLVQRSLTCRSATHAARSVLLSQMLGVPVVVLFLLIGLLLYVVYQRPDLMGPAGDLASGGVASKDIFQTFILTQMPAGARGLMIAGVLAIGPIGINATLNSMASTLMNDIVGSSPARSAQQQIVLSRWLVVACGVALGLVAMGCALWQAKSDLPLLDFAMAVLAFAYTGLLGVFLCALFTKRGSTASVIAALASGAAFCALVQAPTLKGLAALGKGAWLADVAAWLQQWAFSWHFVAGTALSFAVCAAGRRRGATRG